MKVSYSLKISSFKGWIIFSLIIKAYTYNKHSCIGLYAQNDEPLLIKSYEQIISSCQKLNYITPKTVRKSIII